MFVNTIKQSLVNNKLITRTRRSIKCQKTGVQNAETIQIQMVNIIALYVEMDSKIEKLELFF